MLDLIRLKMLLAKKGIYKPVYYFTGKLVFTKKEYDTIRSKLDGIYHYKTITEEEKAYPLADTDVYKRQLIWKIYSVLEDKKRFEKYFDYIDKYIKRRMG